MQVKGKSVIKRNLSIRPKISFCCLMGFVLLVPLAHAQEDATASSGKPSWLITPSISGTMTMTDNAHPGQGQKKSDLITSVSPAIRIDGKGGRVSGNLNFSWQQNIYANESAYDNDQKSLAATGKAELIDQWMFLDAGANITQSPTSVFATQSVGNELATGNRTETTSYNWSPYIQGYFGGSVGYELRYRNTQTTANTGIYATGSGVDSQSWNGRLSGDTPFSLLGWSVSAEDQVVKFGSQRDTKSNRLLGTVEYRIDPQLKINVSAGQESDNYTSFQYQNRSVSGYGLDWAPTERTNLTLKKEKRSFGNGHTFAFSHRTALTAWKLVDSRNVVVPAQQFAMAQVSTAYDLLFLQFASSIPDPVVRAQFVTLLLQLAGIPTNSPIFGGIMTTQPFIQRMRQASFSITGVNNTVVFSAQRSSNESLSTGVSTLDAFALSQNIRQSGFSGSWAHKLTPHSSLTLNALTSTSKGDTAALETRLRSMSLLYSTKLGARTTASLGVRQNNFDNSGATASDYTEHAITGTLSASF
jgi:uncharacterized protein (PEP-CTERM system associated)